MADQAKVSISFTAQIDGLVAALDQVKAQIASLAPVTKTTSASIQSDANKAAAAFKAAAKPIGNEWRSMTEGLIEGTTNWNKIFTRLWEQALDAALKKVEALAISWGAQEAKKNAVTAAGVTARNAAEQAGSKQTLLTSLQTTSKQITNNAATAASGVYSSMSTIPIIGDVLGAAAAAATFAAVIGYEALASAVGGYDIPAGVNPLTQLHAQEMVLPASIAQPLRDMIAANGAVAGGGLAGGDTYNLAVNALDSRSIRRAMDNPGLVRGAAQAFARHA